MAFWKKLAFWHHEPEELSPELPPAVEPEKSFTPKFSPLSEQGLESSFGAQQFGAGLPLRPLQSSQSPDPELRVISAKLDTIKTLLDVVHQRLDRLDKQKGDDIVRWR